MNIGPLFPEMPHVIGSSKINPWPYNYSLFHWGDMPMPRYGDVPAVMICIRSNAQMGDMKGFTDCIERIKMPRYVIKIQPRAAMLCPSPQNLHFSLQISAKKK